MMGLSDGGKIFPIGLAVLIQYRSVTDTQTPSHVAVAITLNALAKASSLKTATDHIFELQYADDAALLSLTADGLQRNLDIIAEAYKLAGLEINTKKTEVLIQESNTHNTIHPSLSVIHVSAFCLEIAYFGLNLNDIW